MGHIFNPMKEPEDKVKEYLLSSEHFFNLKQMILNHIDNLRSELQNIEYAERAIKSMKKKRIPIEDQMPVMYTLSNQINFIEATTLRDINLAERAMKERVEQIRKET